jgi:probable dihydroxyacetone kinase regulator
MKNEDISYQTKHRMAQALKKQMAKKPMDHITVKEIITDCDISRPTFYYHFDDIYDLMKWMFETEMIALLKKSDTTATWDEGILLFMNYIKENQAVCLCAYKSIGQDVLKRMFYDSTRNIVKHFVDTLNQTIHAKDVYVAFIIDFYTQALASCLLTWLKGGLKETPTEMIHLLDIAIHGNIQHALLRSLDK